MSVKLQRINAVVLFVTDLERTKAFYRDTLEMNMTFEDEVGCGFELGSTLLLLLNIDGARDLLTNEIVAEQHSAGASSQLVSFVDDVDAIYAELVGKGVEFVREPIDRAWGLRTAHFKDPEGNIWEIAHSLAKESGQGQSAP